MGGLFSSDSEEQIKLEDQKIKIPAEIKITPKMKKAVKKMKLRKKELLFLWKCYCKIAITHLKKEKKTTDSAYLTKILLAKQLKQPFDIFFQNLFDRWDLDRDDKVEFDEFLIGLYKFLLTNPTKYIEYVFETFDADGDGYLMGDELARILEELHGREEFHQLTARTSMRLYDRKRDGKIDLAEFEETIKNYPVIMWRVTLCKERFMRKIGGRKFWLKLYYRLHPKLKNKHKEVWRQGIDDDWAKAKRCCKVTGTVTVRLFQCMVWPICPCLKRSGHMIEKSPTASMYEMDLNDDGAELKSPHSGAEENAWQKQRTHAQMDIVQTLNSATPDKDARKTRIEQSKLNANIFADTQQVQKRLDMEVLGDHDSSDSEIKEYVKRAGRSARADGGKEKRRRRRKNKQGKN